MVAVLEGGVVCFSYCSRIALCCRYFLPFYLILFSVLLYQVKGNEQLMVEIVSQLYSVLTRSPEFSKRVNGLRLVISLA